MSRRLIFSDIPVITPSLRPDLESIDPELVWIILQDLSISDIQHLCNTSRRFRGICKGPEFERIIQPKIEEAFKPRLLEMSYQDILKTCRKYPILQNFCENDDAFWDAKFRRDVGTGEIFGSFDPDDPESFQNFFGRIPEKEELKFNKDFYEEFLAYNNFELSDIEIRDDFVTAILLADNLSEGYYLEVNRGYYVEYVLDATIDILKRYHGNMADHEYEGYGKLAKAIIEKFNPEISDDLRTLVFDPEEWGYSSESDEGGYSSDSED